MSEDMLQMLQQLNDITDSVEGLKISVQRSCGDEAEVKEKIHFISVERLSPVLKHALIMPGHAAARSAHAMPQATNLIAGEKPVAKDPATVM